MQELKSWALYLFDFVTHLDQHLEAIVAQYQTGTYFILALIVFCETGLVVTPFLPGDSLLFAAGAVTAKTGALDVSTLIGLLLIATLLGDHVNYFAGRVLGRKFVAQPMIAKFAKPEYLEKTEAFFQSYGPKAIVLARFAPIVRTFAPFTAGLGKMPYRQYLLFCVAGAVLWVNSLTFAGYYFGELEFVKKHFELVVFAIIGISVLPMAIEIVKAKLKARSKHPKFHVSSR